VTTLPTLDLLVVVVYLAGVVGLGCYFTRRSATAREYTSAGGALPGWAVGLSVFGTFLSSNTFLGVPGKAYATNFNAFVFGLSLPPAAYLAARYFVPFYRDGGAISAYTHLESRFGPWARTFAVSCYLLTQLARVATILFGVALALSPLMGWRIEAIIIGAGGLVTLYTLLGGIRAVVWTDVMQSIVLTGGALIVAAILLFDVPGGPSQSFAIAREAGKFGLGSFGAGIGQSTVWVVWIYGLFVNLTNFGIDQNYVQRYHAARSMSAARRSVWLGALLYLPVSLLFFGIGAGLFSYYRAQPALLHDLRADVRANAGGSVTAGAATDPTDAQLGDKVFPHFIARRLPPGLTGIILAALLAAAMSSLDSSLNSSATVFLSDVYQRHAAAPDERAALRILRGATIVGGAVGTAAALAMIGIASILDTWWLLAGALSGPMLGLFMLGILSRAGSRAAAISVTVGTAVVVWMTVSPGDHWPPALRSPFHSNLTIAVGAAVIVIVGVAAARIARGSSKGD
jgi:SSS family solute:Na+ symporter